MRLVRPAHSHSLLSQVLRGADRQLDVVVIELDRGQDYINEDEPNPGRIGRVDRHTALTRTHVAKTGAKYSKKAKGATVWVRKACGRPFVGGAVWLWTLEARLRGSVVACDGTVAPASFADYAHTRLRAEQHSLEFEDCLVLRRFSLADIRTIETVPRPDKLPGPPPNLGTFTAVPLDAGYGTMPSSGTPRHELGRQRSFEDSPLRPKGSHSRIAAHRAQWLKQVRRRAALPWLSSLWRVPAPGTASGGSGGDAGRGGIRCHRSGCLLCLLFPVCPSYPLFSRPCRLII